MVLSLQKLFEDFPLPVLSQVCEAQVTSVVSDSRQVVPGSLFVAIQGDSVDGHRFIPQALDQGASAVVGAQEGVSLPVPYIRVGDPRRALAYLSAAFHGYPARKLTVIGVTGTDGKTTTTNLIYHILRAAGLKVGMISTVNAIIGDQVLDTGFHVTTPDAPAVQAYLAQMVEAGLTHVVLEATSHGLAQFRVDACEFDIAVVTNITHEHLDYHGGYAAYREAKARLFQMLGETPPKPQGNPRAAVLNRDDSAYPFLAQMLARLPGVSVVSYALENNLPSTPSGEGIRGEGLSPSPLGRGAGGEGLLPPHPLIFAENILHVPSGTHFEVIPPQGRFPLRCSLLGLFNVSNCLAAIAATVMALNIPISAVQAGVAALPGVPGRMESIQLGQDFTALVDFAHTPNALRVALETCRQLARGRVIVVFGSAGLRDRLKRRLMAETAVQMADLTVLTAEDPRTESLDAILAEMAEGAIALGGIEEVTFWRIPDRGQAIRLAVSFAQPGDVVIACGKGHEQSMCFGTVEYPWDDRTALRAALAERLAIPGPAMPVLPTIEQL